LKTRVFNYSESHLLRSERLAGVNGEREKEKNQQRGSGIELADYCGLADGAAGNKGRQVNDLYLRLFRAN
jgi:hypothetical protein